MSDSIIELGLWNKTTEENLQLTKLDSLPENNIIPGTTISFPPGSLILVAKAKKGSGETHALGCKNNAAVEIVKKNYGHDTEWFLCKKEKLQLT